MPDQLAVFRSRLVLGAVISFISICVIYARVVNFDFVWDDTTVLWGGSSSGVAGNALSIILTNLPISENYFRPFVRAAFAFDMWLFGDKPGPMHLHNLFVHSCSSLLVGGLVVQFLRRFGKLDSAFYPVAATLIFGLHPMLMEPAAWISGRFDAYVTFWLLVLLNLDLLLASRSLRMVSGYTCFLLAAMSKEMAITFPALYILIRMMYLSEQGSLASRVRTLFSDGSAPVFFALTLGGFTYLLLRFSALGYVQQPFDTSIVSAHFGSSLQHVLLVGKTAGTYLMYSIAGGAFTSPVHYEVFPVATADPAAWAGLIVVFCLCVASCMMLLRGNRWGYILLIFFCSLLPVLNIVFWPNTEDMVQERFMSFPLALLVSLLIFMLAQSSWQKKNLLKFLLFIFLTVNGGITAASVGIWRNHLSLWTWAVHRAPLSPYANTNLAVSCRLVGNYACAIRYAEKANELDPVSNLGNYTLAASAVDTKQYNKAIEIADKQIASGSIAGQTIEMQYLKATALNQLGRHQEAVIALENNLRIDVSDHQSSMLLGSVLQQLGDEERANACWALSLQYMRQEAAAKMFSDGNVHIEEIQKKAKGSLCFK